MLEEVGKFLLEHADILGLIYDAITKGVDKARLADAIKREMVEASDALMKKELQP